MQGEKEKVRDTTEGSGQQQQVTPGNEEPNPVGQDSARSEYGEIGEEQVRPGAVSAPPRSLGAKGQEFGQFADSDRAGQQGQSGTGQADLGSQAGSTLSGHTDQQDLGEIRGQVDQPGSVGGGGRQSHTEGEGFILPQPTSPDDPQQRGGTTSASSAKATEGTDFARQGRGASEGEDEEGSVDGSR